MATDVIEESDHMAFCKKCGSEIKENMEFCTICGEKIGAGNKTKSTIKRGSDISNKVTGKVEGLQEDKQDINENRIMAILAYVIYLIPMYGARNSKFARYHACQGRLLFQEYFGLIVGCLVFLTIFSWLPADGILFKIVLILVIFEVGVIVISHVIGIIHACKGEMKPLPFSKGVLMPFLKWIFK